MRDQPTDVDLSPKQADALVEYQLYQADPAYLTPLSFQIAGIVERDSTSKTVYKSLVKNGIILPVPEAASTSTGKDAKNLENEISSDSVTGEITGTAQRITVNTHGITKNFANQHAKISVHAQRKLVGMLFFWEEECVRWRMLDQEERELLSALEHGGSEVEGTTTDLEVLLQSVEMRRALLPSRRGEATTNVGVGVGHELPAYQ